MNLTVGKSDLKGEVEIPASKSHTIRAVVIASLASGRSEIIAPLNSEDTLAAVRACSALGARVELGEDWVVHGTGGALSTPEDVIDVGNSLTTLNITVGTASLSEGCSVFTGDAQIRKRSAQPLIDSLNALGAQVFSTRGNGCAPIVASGAIAGGTARVDGVISQYLSSLLINCPLVEKDTDLEVYNLNEKPYIEMTLGWLDSQGIEYVREGFEWIRIKGGQSYRPYSAKVPGDFSSASFFLCAAAVTDSDVVLKGLNMRDPQGDKAAVYMLEQMGANVDVRGDSIRIRGTGLKGGEFDLNDTPDLLPPMAAVASSAEGTTKLVNVPQARLKETDRLKVLREELSKMGARVQELADGLVIEGGNLRGARVNGHGDHRIVMAMAVAALAAKGRTDIEGAEAVSVTFPNFVDLMRGIGADMELKDS